jgi:hypothetical protein
MLEKLYRTAQQIRDCLRAAGRNRISRAVFIGRKFLASTCPSVGSPYYGPPDGQLPESHGCIVWNEGADTEIQIAVCINPVSKVAWFAKPHSSVWG